MALDRQSCWPPPALQGRLIVHTHAMGTTRPTLEIKLAEIYIQVPNSALGNLVRYSKMKLVPNMHNDDNSDLKNICIYIYFCSLLCLEDVH